MTSNFGNYFVQFKLFFFSFREETEVLVGLCNEDEDSDSEEELDEEDMEEKKELESFQAFLNEKKDLHVSQIVSQQSKPAPQ